MAVPTPEFSPDELNELLSGVMPEIPGYRVMRLLGRGGMSYVYLGVQESLDRQVAIKVIRPDTLKDEVSKLRFEKEARTIAKLQHPCIVGIHEVGRTEQGLLFYVLPFLSKGHLGERELTGDEPRIINVLRALLWALDYAHLRGVVHRDVKAENVLFDNADRPVLTDFGIAISKRDRSRITGTGFAVGSWHHMAPEQARGESVDGRADLYSLGVLTYALLCGELPFQNSEPLGLALMHAVDPVPRLPADKRHWQAFIDKAMAKSRDNRFADAQEMMRALDKVEVACNRGSPAKMGWFTGPPRLPSTQWLSSASLTAPLQRLRPVLSAWRAAVANRLALRPAWRKPLLAVLATLAVLTLAIKFWPAPAPSGVPAQAGHSPALSSPAQSPAVPDPTQPAQWVEPGLDQDAADADQALLADGEVEPAVEAPPPIPNTPGARELAAARQQIIRRRLTQPPGDNALESLRQAHRLAPKAAELPDLGERWLKAATPYIGEALAAGNKESAAALFQHASALSGELQLGSTEGWTALEQAVAVPLLARLQEALSSKDLDALHAAKVEAQALGIATSALEPLWSQPLIIAKRGDRLASGAAKMTITRLPAPTQPGLLAMSSAVTRDQYAAFAAATGRPASTCRIRTALMTLKKRSWDNPGFAQQGDHPAVCVSVADATAYAAWLSARDGVSYRLPSVDEWRGVADYPAITAACTAGQVRCEGEGTAAADSGPISAPGVHAMHGNVREWPADCDAGCRQRLATGFSWRDSPTRTSSRGEDQVDAQYGYDDIGFRLVRDISREELEVR